MSVIEGAVGVDVPIHAAYNQRTHFESALGFEDGARVDVVGVWQDGTERRAEDFRLVSYPTTPGCAAAYYPEANVLVPLDSVADTSNSPTSKGIVVRLESRG